MLFDMSVCLFVSVCLWAVLFSSYRICSTSFSSGNHVDGLPLAVNTGAGVIGRRVGRDKCEANQPLG